MRKRYAGAAGTIAALLFAVAIPAAADAQAAGANASVPTANESFARLSPEEKEQFNAANKDFNAQKFAEALVVYKALLAAHAGDPLLSKMAGESSIDVGDPKYTLELLLPVEAQNPDDWQAAALLGRVYAEAGDKEKRNAEMARLEALYKRGVTPKGLTQYILEKVHVGDKLVIIFNSFEPWGNFKVYNYARVLDSQGRLLSRITLESSDFDQPLWAKQHPEQAAAGGRMFSLDGYADGGTNAAGQHTETHATYGFLDGRPTYDQVRADFINIASGKGGPLSSNTHPAQPAAH
jgi:hypothetical protein